METVKTLKLRIKDKHAKVLLAMARETKRFQPKPARAAGKFPPAVRKVEQVCE